MDSQRIPTEAASWELVDRSFEKDALFQPSDDPSGVVPVRHPKSYVTMLDEYTARKKITATYQLMSIEGMSHEPTFGYKVIADGAEATGRGRKKQDARQMAAQNILRALSAVTCEDDQDITLESPQKLKATNEFSVDGIIPLISSNLAVSFANPPTTNSTDSPLEPAANNVRDVPSETNKKTSIPENEIEIVAPAPVEVYPVPACRVDNPIGSLQELTLSIRWPPPRFEPAGREGFPHDATFTIACYVWSYKCTGKGKSKKLAKREAAYNIYEMLRTSQEVKDLWQKRSEAFAQKTSHSRRAKSSAIPQRAPPMSNVHRDLMASTVSTIEMLRAMSPSEIKNHPDPLDFLREIATEVGFDILFEDLYDLSKKSKSRVQLSTDSSVKDVDIPGGSGDEAASLVILTIPRQIVCFGTGSAKSSARKAAVLNALSYLQTAAAPAFKAKCPDKVDGPDGVV